MTPEQKVNFDQALERMRRENEEMYGEMPEAEPYDEQTDAELIAELEQIGWFDGALSG